MERKARMRVKRNQNEEGKEKSRRNREKMRKLGGKREERREIKRKRQRNASGLVFRHQLFTQDNVKHVPCILEQC